MARTLTMAKGLPPALGAVAITTPDKGILLAGHNCELP